MMNDQSKASGAGIADRSEFEGLEWTEGPKYETYVSGLELAMNSDPEQKHALRCHRVAKLLKRSGAVNVCSYRLLKDKPVHMDCERYRIVFDSSAWIGRHAMA